MDHSEFSFFEMCFRVVIPVILTRSHQLFWSCFTACLSGNMTVCNIRDTSGELVQWPWCLPSLCFQDHEHATFDDILGTLSVISFSLLLPAANTISALKSLPHALPATCHSVFITPVIPDAQSTTIGCAAVIKLHFCRWFFMPESQIMKGKFEAQGSKDTGLWYLGEWKYWWGQDSKVWYSAVVTAEQCLVLHHTLPVLWWAPFSCFPWHESKGFALMSVGMEVLSTSHSLASCLQD